MKEGGGTRIETVRGRRLQDEGAVLLRQLHHGDPVLWWISGREDW